MLKLSFMWALICTTTPVICLAQSHEIDSIYSDSIEYTSSPHLLNEFVVTAAPVINKTDRKVIRPTKAMLNSSSNGLDLLRKLQLSRITINSLTNEIAVAGAPVVLCINGIEATSAQISAIRPEDILRIEYHDNPGVRYAGAVAVIDYIVSRHDSGGNLTLDTFGAFASGKYATIDNFAAQYNHGRSVWSTNIGFMGQQKDNWIRNYEETWNYPDATAKRNETGLPLQVGESGMESIVNYNYMHPDGNIFNVRLGFDFNHVPNMEQGDRHAILTTSLSDTTIIVREHTENNSVQPSIGFYYLHKLSERQNLTFDLLGSYLHSRMLHDYSENGIGETNRVKGNKYSLKFLGLYENRAGSRIYSTGISNNSSVIHNIYKQAQPIEIDIIQTQTTLFSEYSNRFGKWGLMFNIRAAYNYLKQKNQTLNKLFILPAANISYRPAEKYLLKYSASLDYIMPGASELSAVNQPVQNGMIRRGNPTLKPFRVINQSFTASFESSFLSAEAMIGYRNEHNPVMESVFFDNGLFIRTYLNQRSFQRLRTAVSLSIRPWKDHLAITIEPMLNRYFSHGIDYRHRHNIFRIGWNVDISYGHWMAYANIMSGPENKMYGEEIIEEKDMNQIMVGYKHSQWTLHIGVFNAFMHNYWMETRNLSALAPYKSKAHSGRNSSYIAIKLNLSLDFGHKAKQIDAPHNIVDNDSGILTGIK